MTVSGDESVDDTDAPQHGKKVKNNITEVRQIRTQIDEQLSENSTRAVTPTREAVSTRKKHGLAVSVSVNHKRD